MSKIWFTADHHFKHENILDYCPMRPWSRIGKMDRGLITRYRSVVVPEDTVYFVGDLTLEGPEHKNYIERVVEQLPGTKILILGNHDKLHPFTYVDMGFQSVHTALEVEEFILHHDPVAAITIPSRIWLCGHVHQLFKHIRNVINVGVEVWDYYPVSIEEIRKEVEKVEKVG